jgi:malonyl-CoA/methylmalonyl-CoA synthetase
VTHGPLLDLFAPALVGRAHEPALDVGPAGGEVLSLTFGEIGERSSRMAGTLHRRGLRPGDRLAVQLENGLPFLDFFLACLKLGAILVPVNVLYREREVAHVVSDAEPRAVVTTRERAELVPSGTPAWDVEELEEIAVAPLGEAAGAGEAGDPRDDTPAAIVYTSGTTGRAKGAVLTHGNLAANARTLVEAWRITAADRYLAVLPLFHVHGLGNGVCSWLASGCRMRLVPRFEHETAGALFEEFRPTLFFGVPTVYVRLLELPEDAARRIGAGMRLFVSGSAPLPAPVFEAFRARFGHAILERYGMTETLMTVSNPYDGERRPGTVGRPLPGVDLRIVSPEGRDVPEGEPGELLVRGPAVLAGYWRRPDATAAAFADGWFRTGDVGEWSEDGYLAVVGRAKDVVISGGFNVYPKEIELVIDAMPGVLESAVVGIAHADFGEAVTAFVVPRFGVTLSEAGVIAHVKDRLAAFKVPKRVVLVADLPRNAMGKVQKNALRDSLRL